MAGKQPVQLRYEGNMAVYSFDLPTPTTTNAQLLNELGYEESVDQEIVKTLPRAKSGGKRDVCLVPIEKFTAPKDVDALLKGKGLDPVDADSLVFVAKHKRCVGTEKSVFGQWTDKSRVCYIGISRTFDRKNFAGPYIDVWEDASGWEPGWYAVGLRSPKSKP